MHTNRDYLRKLRKEVEKMNKEEKQKRKRRPRRRQSQSQGKGRAQKKAPEQKGEAPGKGRGGKGSCEKRRPPDPGVDSATRSLHELISSGTVVCMWPVGPIHLFIKQPCLSKTMLSRRRKRRRR